MSKKTRTPASALVNFLSVNLEVGHFWMRLSVCVIDQLNSTQPIKPKMDDYNIPGLHANTHLYPLLSNLPFI